MRVQTNKIKKSILGVIVVTCMVVCTCLNTYAAPAEEGEAIPASTDASTVVTLGISSTGTATSTCSVVGTNGITTKISITMYLQKKAGSGKYYTTNTWSGTKSSYIYSLQKKTTVSSGTYRVMAKVTCYKGSTSETIYKYSAAKTY